ncbi:extracellular solute-binding protein [Modestobacter sp. VKM Ac-2986]|uniref:ABC transporter substrate-binding protein n=1 Tax=Modestobacter sp. VKM Ac-2986 TaxID=3004140 RepID=UPI0022ABB431|nr:extracellular solute-binding protein [Modestobacter sp. VKM Ac-2986]MCZ2830461.1 extracellular solute-binding protein [Modestobacter sp. VKM Ac-2986]
MRLKRITSAVAVSLVAASLAGCGGNEETSGGAAEDVTLTYWASNQGTSLENDQEVLKPQLDAFTAATGIKVDVEVVPWSDLLNRILAATASGEGPDVLNIGNTWSASLQATGALKPFDDATMTEIGGADRFLAGSLAATGAEGQPPTAVPLYSLAYGLYYNKAMFAEAGITEPPATWADLIAAGKKLTTPERWGMSIEGGSVSENIHNVFVFSEQQGGSFFDDAGKPTFDTPENVAGIKQYLDLIQTDKITNPSNAEYSNGTEALADFASGKSAMVMWQAAAGSLEELGMDPADIGVAPIPAPAGGEDVASIVAGINLAVFENTEHEQQALDFVEFMTSTPTQIELNGTYGSLPAVQEAYSDPAFQTEAVETFKSILDTRAVPMPAVPEESQFETLVGTAVKNMLAQAASGTVVTEQAISEQLAAAQQQLAG